jgi:hypothetical protein
VALWPADFPHRSPVGGAYIRLEGLYLVHRQDAGYQDDQAQRLERFLRCHGRGGQYGVGCFGRHPGLHHHTIAGGIAGSGAAHNVKRVRWDMSINLAIAWVLTIPASALMAAVFWWIGTRFL